MILEKSVCFINRNFRMWLSWHLASKLYKFQRRFPFEWCWCFCFVTAHCSLSLSRSPYFEIGKEATANLALAAMQPQCFWHGCCWSECISVITTKRWQTSLGMLVKLHKNTHYHKHKHIAQICVCTYTHKLFQVKFCGDFFQYVRVCVSELFAFGISESGLLQQFG